MSYQRYFSRLFTLLLMFSFLINLTGCGCSHKNYNNYYYNYNNSGGTDSKRHNIYYQFSRDTVAKAVDAGATHVGGFAYDDNGNIDSKFAVAKQDIDEMDKAEDGDYLAQLNISGNAKHVDLYFYYESDGEKLATNCKYFRVDFAATTLDDDIIIDCDDNDVYFTIKTFDSMGLETSNFAAGDKIFTKVLLTCQGEGCFFAPIDTSGSANGDKTFAVTALISDDTDVAALSSEKDEEYLLFDALTAGTANLYVQNFDYTCIFTEHEVNVDNYTPDYTAVYIAPQGYTVSKDGSKILDPNGREVKAANLPKTQVLAAGASHTFVAIGAIDDGTAAATYELLGKKADAVLKTESQNINNDGFKVSVAAGATADDKASISAKYGELTSNVINITVEAAADFTAIYVAPEGYTVSDDGTKILDPNGREVDVANLPDTQAIATGESHTFVAIGAKDDGTAAATYALLGDAATAVLDTASQNITNDGFKVSVTADAAAADTATISAEYGDLTSNAINITVEVPPYLALYVVPWGYDPSDDGREIRDPYDDPIDPADLPTKQTMEFGTSYNFKVIGAKEDEDGNTIYEMVTTEVTAEMTTEAETITNENFKVTVARNASENETAVLQAACGSLKSAPMNVCPVPFRAIYLVDGTWVLSDDGSKIYDPEYPDDPDDWDFVGYVYDDFFLGVNFGFGALKNTDVPFQVIVIDTVEGRLKQIPVKVNTGDDGAEITLSGEVDNFTLKLSESSVHINSDATSGVEGYVSTSYRGLESEPRRYIITVQ